MRTYVWILDHQLKCNRKPSENACFANRQFLSAKRFPKKHFFYQHHHRQHHRNLTKHQTWERWSETILINYKQEVGFFFRKKVEVYFKHQILERTKGRRDKLKGRHPCSGTKKRNPKEEFSKERSRRTKFFMFFPRLCFENLFFFHSSFFYLLVRVSFFFLLWK